ncbi:MAG: hypothetical protein J6X48_00730 [Lachnospiraceae bacterium]|jgi:predicted PurR-regulated permease PerM|nr:hypothetical protein [Lachnospiraceae bacterium]MBP5598790.1 hypothetical protein [Lachnospiraceae bacterium]
MNNELEELKKEIRTNRILLIIILVLVLILLAGFIAGAVIVAKYINIFESQLKPLLEMASKIDIDKINNTITNIQSEIDGFKESIEAFKENFSGLFNFFGK